MGADTKIQWAHHTFSPWWGCQRVSPGCENCYAEAFDHRLGRADWGPNAPRRFFGNGHWSEPLKWDRAATAVGERHRVFCASMADVFEDRRDLDEQRARLCKLIEATPNLDWLLLTKRPENQRLLPPSWTNGDAPTNVWFGTTAEDQKRADERIPHLLRATWAAVRFVSYEPALEQINFHPWLCRYGSAERPEQKYTEMICEPRDGARVDWIIVGGESGPEARPFNMRWARDVVERCRAAGVAAFVKQLGRRPFYVKPDGARVDLSLRDHHGGNWDEWPCVLRVRQFPGARACGDVWSDQ